MSRRKVLIGIIGIGGTALAAAVGGPAFVHSLSPNLRDEPEEIWVPIGRINEFSVGETKKAVVRVERDDWAQSMREKAVYVWLPNDAEFVVFSRACTDLGCPVEYDQGSRWFFCPCHGGIFAQDGERKAGPPKRPLDRYRNRVRDGILEIDLKSVPPTV